MVCARVAPEGMSPSLAVPLAGDPAVLAEDGSLPRHARPIAPPRNRTIASPVAPTAFLIFIPLSLLVGALRQISAGGAGPPGPAPHGLLRLVLVRVGIRS